MRLRLRGALKCVCLSAAFSLVWYVSFHRIEDYMEWKVLNNKLSIHPATICYYLPHLQKNEDAIYPKVITEQSRTGVFLVIGISSVRRKKESYLMSTLNSLFNGMSKYQKKNCVIVVLIAEVNSAYVSGIAGNIKRRWRTKQNLDYSFLMMYAQQKGMYYLQLEDDIVANPRYLYTINDFIEQKISQEWIVLEFSQLGFIGKLFRCKDLPLIVEFFLMFYKDKPIDWLLEHLISVKVCNPEKNGKDCESRKSNLRIRYKPSLFQHVGFHSSLAGKTQKLRDEDFVKTSLFREHANPPAKMKTSLKVFQQFTLENAYNGIEIFWAFAPKAGDYILFSFEEPLKIVSYLFRSGNSEHPRDILFNATVEVLPSKDINLQTVRNNENNINVIKTWDGFFQIDNFEDGVAKGAILPFLGNIQALRLFIHSNSSKWILLSEIFIQT
ncbi:alpha-1,3-mannosyl-glycoprotein 4-beta-N-acetylglucosaminyltransferase-like protein MGAT4D isoform X3 [Crotalus tigris]|uniref:alpha-1,3-mannosyl-glycoprotein 4-beta-N-acetylglucosaminyltransferase-like protein MGAT4D isoform X3 n=1 Tax=Crotalus tigris TaxID=88082 RepID=UPI00192FB2E3|nr:alpha-1,3-mannosyl-glycoprotein 4-beta-N-acetylglucosaminyltransferase-like protein MGAT4D isoform X3 [Crotalus tigris]